jgi:predicted RNA binding protein YcfA (HicA-like mRNA interferase family)
LTIDLSVQYRANRERQMNRKKLLRILARGHLQNVAFADFVHLVKGFGFELLRASGTHHIFGRPDIPELVNLQEVGGQAKPYQIRQFLRLVERYNVKVEED